MGAVKQGATDILLNFEYSQETLEKFPDTEFVSKRIVQSVRGRLRVYDGALSFKPVFDLTGVYVIKDPKGIIEVDKDGNWKVLKSGDTIYYERQFNS